jgi:hypothetical protein
MSTNFNFPPVLKGQEYFDMHIQEIQQNLGCNTDKATQRLGCKLFPMSDQYPQWQSFVESQGAHRDWMWRQRQAFEQAEVERAQACTYDTSKLIKNSTHECKRKENSHILIVDDFHNGQAFTPVTSSVTPFAYPLPPSTDPEPADGSQPPRKKHFGIISDRLHDQSFINRTLGIPDSTDSEGKQAGKGKGKAKAKAQGKGKGKGKEAGVGWGRGRGRGCGRGKGSRQGQSSHRTAGDSDEEVRGGLTEEQREAIIETTEDPNRSEDDSNVEEVAGAESGEVEQEKGKWLLSNELKLCQGMKASALDYAKFKLKKMRFCVKVRSLLFVLRY